MLIDEPPQHILDRLDNQMVEGRGINKFVTHLLTLIEIRVHLGCKILSPHSVESAGVFRQPEMDASIFAAASSRQIDRDTTRSSSVQLTNCIPNGLDSLLCIGFAQLVDLLR